LSLAAAALEYIERAWGTTALVGVLSIIAALVIWLFASGQSANRETEGKSRREEETRIAKEVEEREKKKEKERLERQIAAEKVAMRAAEISQQAADYSLALESEELAASEVYARLSTEAHDEGIRLIARLEAQGLVETFLDLAFKRLIRGDEHEQENQDAFDIEFERLVRKLKYREKNIDYYQKRLRSHLEGRFRKFVEVRRGRGLHRVESLKKMSGDEFEVWVIEQLRSHGYKANATPVTGDHGGDVVADIGETRVCIQAKRWKGTVGKDAVYQVNTARVMYDATFAWVVTNSTFTKQAKEVAAQVDVTLVDRAVLMQFDQFLQDWARVHASPSSSG